MSALDTVAARVQASSTVAELLDAAFDAFEIIRQVARACEVRVPELFATFMTAAGTAVEGRNILNDAPSLPMTKAGPVHIAPEDAAGDVDHIADQLAGLVALVDQYLRRASTVADVAGDHTACRDAAQAAAQIHCLLARDADETCPR